jgi:hypothetical protein
MSVEQFNDVLRAAILSLPQHLKATLRLLDDPNIPDEGRMIAAGAVLHWLSGSNTIPGMRAGLSSLADDLIVLLFAYERIDGIAPEAMAKHRADSPELFDGLTADVALIRSYLGKGVSVFDKAVEKIPQLKHLGRNAAQCIADEESSTVLHEQVHAALVELDLEEDEVNRALKQLGPVFEGLRQRR